MALVTGVILTTGCSDRPPVDWSPVLESASTSYLNDEIGRALDDLSRARASLPSDPAEAGQAIDQAEAALERLRDVHVPLLDARERAYNAYRLHYLGRRSEAIFELEEIRTMILGLGRVGAGGEAFLSELARIEELVAHARIELEADSPSATQGLRALAQELDDVMNRAGIFLGNAGGG